jgi:hypothetical protein
LRKKGKNVIGEATGIPEEKWKNLTEKYRFHGSGTNRYESSGQLDI